MLEVEKCNFVVMCRSDVLGQVMPLVGRDWTQSGVTRLFSAIKVLSYARAFDFRSIKVF